MKKLIGLLALLCIYANCFGQKAKAIKPLFIDSNMPNVTIQKIINYKDSSVNFYDLKKKLTILDFWSIHCSDCIAQFPKELELQKQFGNEIQIVLVTVDPVNKTKSFIKNWETQHHLEFNLPIIVEDTLLHQYFRGFFQPNYAWLDYEPHLMAQTNEYFLNAANIMNVLHEIDTLKAILDADK